MERIETVIWEPVPDKPNYVTKKGARKVREVFSELKAALESAGLLPDEYFILDSDFVDENMDCPEFCDVICYAQWGSNEGIYLELDVVYLNEQDTTYVRKNFATGKTLAEDGRSYDRMQYIAGYIYKLFMGGKTVNYIAKHLMQENIPSPSGKVTWRTTTIESILTNEKYKGSAILQKKFTVDFLQKKMKVNEGEVPQYKVEESHPAIIDPEEWEIVQLEMKRRKLRGKHHNSLSPFSAKFICGDCGAFYGSKVWHSNSKYRRTIWQCNNKFKGEKICQTPHLYEEDIKSLFIRAFSKLMSDRTALIEDCRLLYDSLLDFSESNTRCNELMDEMEIVSELVKKLINENAASPMNQDEYISRYDGYTVRFNKAKDEYEKLRKAMEQRQLKADIISGFMFEISELDDLPIEFDEKLWNSVIDMVTVYEDERLVFKFKNGAEIEEQL